MTPVILSDYSDRFDPAHTALIIIDMQKDFCLEGYGAHRAGRDITAARNAIGSISKLRDTARTAGVQIAHVGFSTLPDHASDSGPWLAQRRRSTDSSDSLCITGTNGAQFIEQLAPCDGEWIILKHRYSAFTGTDLDLLLRSRRVQSLVFAGVSTNACIESSLRAGFELDYYICVPPDATGSWNNDLHEATLANVNHRFGVTLNVDEIIKIWTASNTNKGNRA